MTLNRVVRSDLNEKVTFEQNLKNIAGRKNSQLKRFWGGTEEGSQVRWSREQRVH